MGPMALSRNFGTTRTLVDYANVSPQLVQFRKYTKIYFGRTHQVVQVSQRRKENIQSIRFTPVIVQNQISPFITFTLRRTPC